MMISPEQYYEMNLKGKNQREILREIRSLKREINRLKRVLQDPDQSFEKMILPDPMTMISCNRDYLEYARRAYEEAGGKYEPTREELRDQEFNASLQYMKRFIFIYGGFAGIHKKVYTISGDEVLCETESMIKTLSADHPEEEPLDREEFLREIAKLHLGEWKKNYIDDTILDGVQWSIEIQYEDGRKPVHFYGSNDFPYNFDELLRLLNMDV